MWECNRCHTQNADKHKFCIECGSSKSLFNNYCINPKCKSFKVMLDNPEQKFCGDCGESTAYWKEIEKQI